MTGGITYMHIEDYTDCTDYTDYCITFSAWKAKQQSFGCSSELNAYLNWYVVPCGRSRDSDCLEESNFHAALSALGGESNTVCVQRFGHWAVGWTEVILVHPSHGKAVAEIACALASYAILDDHDHSEREQSEADSVWQHCYNQADRIAYIRAHRNQFEFRDLQDMLGCARGHYFAGCASELLG